jgi:carbon monoxide dehydrogenase subunit G
MKFSGEFSVPAERPVVFERLNDPQFFASCLDGVQDLVEVEPTRYTATLETRIAYLKFKFVIAVEVTGREPPSRVFAKAEGTPLGIVGRLTAAAAATLEEAGEQTLVCYDIDVALTGKLGSIGQPVLRSKAREMERSFVGRVNAAFVGEAEPVAAAAAESP